MLYKLAAARIAVVHRPEAMQVLKNCERDHHAIRLPQDGDGQRYSPEIIVTKAMAFGVTIDMSILDVNLKANMEYAQSHEGGHKFKVSG
jgi:hypothetical protein